MPQSVTKVRCPMQNITPFGPTRSQSVLGYERDDDVGRFGLVQFETGPIVIAPVRKIHDLGRLGCPGRLDRLHDVEPVAVEEKCVFPEQVSELWNHRMVVGNSAGFELAQSSLELCGVKFHCTLLSVRSKAVRRAIARLAGASHLEVVNAKLGHPARPT